MAIELVAVSVISGAVSGLILVALARGITGTWARAATAMVWATIAILVAAAFNAVAYFQGRPVAPFWLGDAVAAAALVVGVFFARRRRE
jgi:hypothetical protein